VFSAAASTTKIAVVGRLAELPTGVHVDDVGILVATFVAPGDADRPMIRLDSIATGAEHPLPRTSAKGDYGQSSSVAYGNG
jgi:hypothetical protein